MARIALVLLVSLVAGCSLPLSSQHGTRSAPPSAAASPSSPVVGLPAGEASAPAGSLEAFIPVAVSFVEEHRGLRFKSAVKVLGLPDAEFRARLAGKRGQDEAALRTEAKVLEALGLLQGHPDLVRAEQALLGATVVGYYEPKTKELVVRGVEASPGVRRVVVHELTHALQDQWFSIDRPSHDDDESDLAFRTLVEGDAVRIERQYLASLTEAERRQIRSDDGAIGRPPPEVPLVLIELEAFPYVVGPRFTESIIISGGQARLDAAFTAPPTTTAEVLHPDRFLAGNSGPSPVEAPLADGPVIDRGVLGEFGLRLVMAPLTESGQVSDAEHQAVALGWSGDRYVAWELGDKACVRTRFVMNGAAATMALRSVLQKYAGGHSLTTVEGTGPVTFTACG